MSKPNIIVQIISFIGRKLNIHPKRPSVKSIPEDHKWPTEKTTIGYEVLLEKMRNGTYDDIESSWMQEMKRRHNDPVKKHQSTEMNPSYRISTIPNLSL